MKQRWLWVIAGLAIGAGLLWYSVRAVSFVEVAHLIANANAGYLLLAVGLSIAFIAVKTQRWSMLLRPMSRLGFLDLHSPVYAGTAANLAISHLGELVRARMLGRRSGLPVASILASIGLERVLDMLAMLMLLGYLFVAGGGYLTPALAAAAQVAAALASVAALTIVLILLWPVRCSIVVTRVTAWLPRAQGDWIKKQLEDVVGGFRAVSDPRLVARVLLASLVQWCVIAASIWCCMKAVGITLDSAAAVAVLVLLVLGLTLPTAPAYLGTTQVAFTAALSVFGIEEQTAFAGSVLYTICVVMPMLIIGTACLLHYFHPALGKGAVPSAR